MSKPLIVVFAFLLFAPLLSAQTKLDSIQNEFQNYLKPVKWRCIGPFRGGRSVAACGVIGNPKVYYMGTTGGGLWKSTDMAMSWDNVSDGFFKPGPVGAVRGAASDDNVDYVGM
nr:glycosyl hydrolase [Saprospiraceae bacterium]